MKFDAVQLMRVAEEILKYFYLKGARTVRLSYDFGEDNSYCAITAQELVLEADDFSYIHRVFSGPVQPEVANYYGSLVGRRRSEIEMELAGAMCELEELISEPGIGTRMVVSRREADYHSSRRR